MSANGQNKIYEMVTERVVTAMKDAIEKAGKGEKALAPWRKPWHGGFQPMNLVSKKPYRGMNAFLLAMMDFETPYFVSYKQAKQLGGTVKKGEKGVPVIFWKVSVFKKDQNGNELDEPKKLFLLRYYTVFNISQTEGIDEKKIPKLKEREFNPIEEGEAIILNMPNRPELSHSSTDTRAYYRPSTDSVNLPKKELFTGDAEYYTVAFHELIHSTGHTTRLNRKEVMDLNLFGSHDYSIEELVAEMGAVFLCNQIGIESTFDNSIAYLKSWLKKFQDDTKMLVTASARAQKAVDYITDSAPDYKEKDQDSQKSQPKKEEKEEEEIEPETV